MKPNKETIKTVVLTLLIGAILGFIGGVKAQSEVTDQLTSAIKHQIVAPVAAQTVSK